VPSAKVAGKGSRHSPSAVSQRTNALSVCRQQRTTNPVHITLIHPIFVFPMISMLELMFSNPDYVCLRIGGAIRDIAQRLTCL
jgi:hypothetical protein